MHISQKAVHIHPCSSPFGHPIQPWNYLFLSNDPWFPYISIYIYIYLCTTHIYIDIYIYVRHIYIYVCTTYIYIYIMFSLFLLVPDRYIICMTTLVSYHHISSIIGYLIKTSRRFICVIFSNDIIWNRAWIVLTTNNVGLPSCFVVFG